MEISHLQYTDDALFFREWSTKNATKVLQLLKNFEAALGLKINLRKSRIIRVGVPSSETQILTSKFHCQAETLPFLYLRLPVGASMKRRSNWSAIEQKFMKKMTAWKAQMLSMGGRVTLTRSILNSLPLYYFSLFRAPSFLSDLEKRRNMFLWGGASVQRKMIWASNLKTYGDYSVGGLKIGSLDEKNIALLSKWWWWFRTERNSFWP